MTFVIKFLPILQGVSLIHIYSQNKLSRHNDTETSITPHKNYKEIDIIYGSEIKNSNNIEFRYTEPKKLKEIERFFIEFFISTTNKFDLFYHTNHDIKYFDNSLILIIDEIINQNKNATLENIVNKINNKFYENYLNGGEIDKGKILEKINKGDIVGNILLTGNTGGGNQNNDSSSLENSVKKVMNANNNSDLGANMNINTNIFTINKEFILREIINGLDGKRLLNTADGNVSQFNQPVTKTPYNNQSYIDNTLMLSKLDDNPIRLTNNNYEENPDREYSFELTKNISSISKVDNPEEGDQNFMQSYIRMPTGNGGNLTNYLNNSTSFDIAFHEIDKKTFTNKNDKSIKKILTNNICINNNNNNINQNSQSPNIKSNDRSIARNLSKLHQSINNIERIRSQSTNAKIVANNNNSNPNHNNTNDGIYKIKTNIIYKSLSSVNKYNGKVLNKPSNNNLLLNRPSQSDIQRNLVTDERSARIKKDQLEQRTVRQYDEENTDNEYIPETGRLSEKRLKNVYHGQSCETDPNKIENNQQMNIILNFPKEGEPPKEGNICFQSHATFRAANK